MFRAIASPLIAKNSIGISCPSHNLTHGRNRQLSSTSKASFLEQLLHALISPMVALD